jgi:hypothetical protein
MQDPFPRKDQTQAFRDVGSTYWADVTTVTRTIAFGWPKLPPACAASCAVRFFARPWWTS